MRKIHGNAYWASIINPNTKFDTNGVWSIDVCNLDERNKNTALEDNLVIKNKNDSRGNFITIKRKVRRKDGGLNIAPTVLNIDKKPLTNIVIGNGSKVKVTYNPYNWKFAGSSGTSADLIAVQVIELITYDPYSSLEKIENIA